VSRHSRPSRWPDTHVVAAEYRIHPLPHAHPIWPIAYPSCVPPNMRRKLSATKTPHDEPCSRSDCRSSSYADAAHDSSFVRPEVRRRSWIVSWSVAGGSAPERLCAVYGEGAVMSPRRAECIGVAVTRADLRARARRIISAENRWTALRCGGAAGSGAWRA